MIRTILRNVQNTLVLSSVLLVILALQRLQSYDLPYTSSSLFHEGGNDLQEGDYYGVVDYAEEPAIVDPPIMRVGSHHHVVLGREYHIGLFRFVLPRLERKEETVVLASKSKTFKKKRNKSPGTRPSSWQVLPETSRVAFVMDMSTRHLSCWDVLDAAAVFKQSLQRRRNYSLHAILSHHEQCNETRVLRSLGYRVVPSHRIDKTSCSATADWLHYGRSLIEDADVVVHIPTPTSMVIKTPSDDAVATHRFLRPNHPDKTKGGMAIEAMRLTHRTSSTNCNATTVLCQHDQPLPCQISRSVSLVTFHGKTCPFPACQTNTTTTTTTTTNPSCQEWQNQWKNLLKEWLYTMRKSRGDMVHPANRSNCH